MNKNLLAATAFEQRRSGRFKPWTICTASACAKKARNGSGTVRSTAPPEWPEWGQDWTEVAHHPKHHPVILVVVRLEIRRIPALPFQIRGRPRTGGPPMTWNDRIDLLSGLNPTLEKYLAPRPGQHVPVLRGGPGRRRPGRHGRGPGALWRRRRAVTPVASAAFEGVLCRSAWVQLELEVWCFHWQPRWQWHVLVSGSLG
jgi:hypothetical protein